MTGDPSDNIPGTPGIGFKTAAVWVQEAGKFKRSAGSKQQANLTGHISRSSAIIIWPV